MRLAPGLRRPTWIMAKRQTDGRGRRGRGWSDLPGNFKATLMMKPGGMPAWAALRSFLASNALYETLAMYVDREALSLKWPNDVLLNDRKVAGILLESTGSAALVDWLAIGIGVNLRSAPPADDNAKFPPIALAEVGDLVTPAEFLTVLAGHYATEERILERLGFQAIRADWLERAARLGDTITARTAREEISGIFDSIDETGQLVLITAKGPVKIPAADVYF